LDADTIEHQAGPRSTLGIVAVARTGEIGIRLAVGAPRWQVIALLFQVEPTDPWTLIEVVALLIVVAAAASLAPALSAARTDVAGSLRRH
jgi:ABC-type antimicrobial peptide transport system permease subunit